VVSGADAASPEGIRAATAAGIKKVRSEMLLHNERDKIRMEPMDLSKIQVPMNRLHS